MIAQRRQSPVSNAGRRRRAMRVAIGALLRTFVWWVVPSGAKGQFHTKKGRAFILETDCGRPTRFKEEHALRHLTGLAVYAKKADDDSLARFAVVDIDEHLVRQPIYPGSPPGLPPLPSTLWDRFKAVRKALGVPVLALRSSSSGGLHVYVFFDAPYRVADIHARVKGALERAKITIKSGSIEVFPKRGCLRLPLGSGSCIMNPKTQQPLFARITGRGVDKDERDVQELIRFATASAVPLMSLPAPKAKARPALAAKPSKATRTHWRASQATSSPIAPASLGYDPKLYWDELCACWKGVSAFGRRHYEQMLITRHLYLRCGLVKDEVIDAVTVWINTGSHTSKELAKDPVGTRKAMVKDIPCYLEHLDDEIAAGKFQRNSSPQRKVALPGCSASPSGSPGGGYVTLRYLVDMLEHRCKNWQRKANRYLKLEDLEFLENVPDVTVRDALAILLGLLRAGEVRGYDVRLVSMHSAAMAKITGKGRKVSIDLPAGFRSVTVSRYKRLRQEAVALGLLHLQTTFARGQHANIYRVTLPGSTDDSPPSQRGPTLTLEGIRIDGGPGGSEAVRSTAITGGKAKFVPRRSPPKRPWHIGDGNEHLRSEHPV
jgi:hypothetical protein